MPLDESLSGAILGTFRTMAQDIKDKKFTGDDVDQMNAALARMEELAQQHSDMNDFNGAMMQENLFMKFSDFYGRALASGSSAQYQLKGEGYGPEQDKQLLDQTVNAYRDAIKRLQQAKKDTIAAQGEKKASVFLKEDLLIKPIQDVINLAESGISYALFLRYMIEQGLDKAMEGSIATREGLIYSRDMAVAMKASPYEALKAEDHLANFDYLTSITKFNTPSVLKLNLANEKSDLPHNINYKRWYAIQEHWEKVISNLSDWAIAHCSFAHTLEPWSMAANPAAAVRETIECNPGAIAVRLNQLERNFGIDFNGIFEHETFIWEVQYFKLWYSQEYISFLKNEVYPICKPGQKLSDELISKMESIYKENKLRNPELHRVLDEYIKVHDSYFGAGAYEAEHSRPEKYESGAAAWNLNVFA